LINIARTRHIAKHLRTFGLTSINRSDHCTLQVTMMLLPLLLGSCPSKCTDTDLEDSVIRYTICLKVCEQQLNSCVKQFGCGRLYNKKMPARCWSTYKQCLEGCDYFITSPLAM